MNIRKMINSNIKKTTEIDVENKKKEDSIFKINDKITSNDIIEINTTENIIIDDDDVIYINENSISDIDKNSISDINEEEELIKFLYDNNKNIYYIKNNIISDNKKLSEFNKEESIIIGNNIKLKEYSEIYKCYVGKELENNDIFFDICVPNINYLISFIR